MRRLFIGWVNRPPRLSPRVLFPSAIPRLVLEVSCAAHPNPRSTALFGRRPATARTARSTSRRPFEPATRAPRARRRPTFAARSPTTRTCSGAVPPEVLERDYGCGDPTRHLRPGDTVLDLGSGAGKACFLAAQVVGPSGRVIGVDMNADMLDLARRNLPRFAESVGYANVEFRRGRIQDLALDSRTARRVPRHLPSGFQRRRLPPRLGDGPAPIGVAAGRGRIGGCGRLELRLEPGQARGQTGPVSGDLSRVAPGRARCDFGYRQR